MQQHTMEKLIKEYREAYDAIPQAALELDLRITIKTIQAIANGIPISPHQLSNIWEISLEQVQGILEQAKTKERVELDNQGDLVGAVLSLNPTNHQVTIGSKNLYAWCAYDAIYIPGVLGKPGQIISQDPVSGEKIRVSISPSGVENIEPDSAVVSVVGAKGDLRAGPDSPRCTQMLFFGSRQSAERWQVKHAGITILTVEEVFEMAKEFQIEPARRLGLV